MELEEAEDEELDTSKYWSKNNVGNGCKFRWVVKRGLCLCRKCLVAGFLASAAPVVVPPLVVASAIGIVVSMPYAFFLASHACTQSLMSKLLPRPTPPLHEICFFQPVSDVTHTCKEEKVLEDEAKRYIEMVYVQCVENGENVTTCGDVNDGMEGHSREETNGVQVQPKSGDNEVLTMIEEFKTPFGVTTVVLEESEDQAMDGDIEEEELQRETKGLLEKIRDEGRTDMTQVTGECVEGICGGENESDKKIGAAVEDVEVAWEDTHNGIVEGTAEELRKEEDPNVYPMLQSRNDESNGAICYEVESLLEGKEFDDKNGSQKATAEPSELLIPDEPIGDLPIEAPAYNILVDEDSSEDISENIDLLIVVKEEPENPPDCCTLLQEGDLDNNIYDLENQESQLEELNEMVNSSDAEARENANESELDLFDGKGIVPDVYVYTIDLHEESSNVDGHTDSMEVLVSSGENIICPSQEVVLDEENIWKQINVIRKVVGYEGTKKASYADELKALYIFTGVEPPTSLNDNTNDPAEIKEKLHFLMSIVGIKSNVA